MSTAAVIILLQKKYIRRFRDAGAVDENNAVVPEEVGCRQSLIFRRMESKGIFKRDAYGRYYLDNSTAEAYIKLQKIVIFTSTAILLVIFILFWIICSI